MVKPISADDLVAWSERPESSSHLPWLLRTLIRQVAGPEVEIQFNTGSGVFVGGVDGSVSDNRTANPYIPAGPSVWEVSTKKQHRVKANTDYRNRSDDEVVDDKKSKSYVQVSLRRVNDRESWAELKRADAIWKDVRHLDAEDLAELLQQYPTVASQLAAAMGLPDVGVSPEEWWSRLTFGCEPQICDHWLLTNRGEEAEGCLKLLRERRRAISIAGTGQIEALGFLHACIASLPDGDKELLAGRTLYIHNEKDFLEAGKLVSNAILVPLFGFDATLMGSVNQTNSVVLCGQPLFADTQVELSRAKASDLYSVVSATVGERETATRIATAMRNGLEFVMAEVDGGIAPPFPTSGFLANELEILAACLLLNRWNSSNPADVDALSKLSGNAYDVIEATLRKVQLQQPPSFRKAGAAWFATCDRLAWATLDKTLSSATLDTFVELACAALKDDDPTFELPPERRWMANIQGVTPRYSQVIKDGISRTLLLLADRGPLGDCDSGQKFVDSVTSALFTGASPSQWFSLGPHLRRIAEASPQVFLDKLRADLEEHQYSVAGLHAQVSDPFSGGSRHHYLLWAIECVAWNPEFLLQACEILVMLHEIGLGSDGNNPLGSLRGLFLPWHPSTSANLEVRLKVLSRLRDDSPKTFWSLLIQLLPSDYSNAFPNSRPELRKWGPPTKPQMRSEVSRAHDQLIIWASEYATGDAERLIELIPVFACYPERWFNAFAEALTASIDLINKPEDRLKIWRALCDTIFFHSKHESAAWAMDSSRAETMSAIAERFTPEDPVAKSQWLFRQWVDDLPPSELPKELQLAELRQAALHEIIGVAGVSGLLRLADLAESPGEIGHSLGTMEHSGLPGSVDFYANISSSENPNHRQMARGFAIAMVQASGGEWFREALRADLSDVQRGELFAAQVPTLELWVELERESSAVQSHYWHNAYLRTASPRDSKTCNYLVGKLIQYDRAIDAAQWLSLHARHDDPAVDAGLVSSTLESLKVHIETSQSDGWSADEWRLISFAAEYLLEYLHEAPEADHDRTAVFEFYFMPLFRRGSFVPKALHSVLLRQPEMYVDFVCAISKKCRKSKEVRKIQPEQALHVVDSFRLSIDDNTFDGDDLNAWLLSVNSLAEERGVHELALSFAGAAVGRSGPGLDGNWPHEAVSCAIELVDADPFDDGVYVGKCNTRGAFFSSRGEGELLLESEYRAFANARKRFVRTEKILNNIADYYRYQAAQAKKEAEIEEDIGH